MKERLDVLLVQQGFFNSREKAKAAIKNGDVYVDGLQEKKAGATIEAENVKIEVRGERLKYVSRGGLKLERAISSFGIALEGLTCMDIGASTGGFTDCMLQNGAKKVYSIDVGTNQLAKSLLEDSRVVSMENTNFRYLKPEDLQDVPDFASVDVSFISLTKILEPAYLIIRDDAHMVCLIKPQFEAGRERLGKNGVVRDKKVHEAVISEVMEYAKATGFKILGLDYSPIKGPEGNIEYLLYLEKQGGGVPATYVFEGMDIKSTVETAHKELDK